MSEYFLLSDKKFVLKESMPSGGGYYRGPHDTERVDMTLANEDLRYIPNVNPFLKGRVRSVVTQNNTSLPEVYRLLPFHSVPLTEELQWLWKNINPELSNEKWATLLGSSLAWCNGTGFSDSDPKRDYVNRRNLDSSKLPAFDQVRFTGGAIFRGQEDGDIVWIETIDALNPPTAEYVLSNSHLWYWGTSVSPRGDIYYINRLGLDGTLKHVRIPLITRQRVYLPKVELHRLMEGIYPVPTWKYYG